MNPMRVICGGVAVLAITEMPHSRSLKFPMSWGQIPVVGYFPGLQPLDLLPALLSPWLSPGHAIVHLAIVIDSIICHSRFLTSSGCSSPALKVATSRRLLGLLHSGGQPDKQIIHIANRSPSFWLNGTRTSWGESHDGFPSG